MILKKNELFDHYFRTSASPRLRGESWFFQLRPIRAEIAIQREHLVDAPFSDGGGTLENASGRVSV